MTAAWVLRVTFSSPKRISIAHSERVERKLLASPPKSWSGSLADPGNGRGAGRGEARASLFAVSHSKGGEYAGNPPVRLYAGCALQVRLTEPLNMAAAVKLSEQPRTEPAWSAPPCARLRRVRYSGYVMFSNACLLTKVICSFALSVQRHKGLARLRKCTRRQ